MLLLWGTILYMSVAAFAQNINVIRPENNPPASAAETSFPSSTSGNFSPDIIPVANTPLLSSENETIPEAPKVSSCPEGYECYPEIFCENVLSEGPITESTAVRRCPEVPDVCCYRNQTEKNDAAKKCGLRNPFGVSFRITDEIGTHFGEYPWMAMIMLKNVTSGKDISVYQAGGALIHPSVVLTAAHRVSGYQTNILRVRLGEWDVLTTAEVYPHQDRDVAQVLIHSDFEAGNLKNDIALVFLAAPVDLAENVQTVCLPPPDSNFDRRRCIATGWGKDVYGIAGIYDSILKKIELPIVPLEECQSMLRETRLSKFFELHDSFVCAGGEAGRDTCNGDGGSPLICPIDEQGEQYYQVGLVAWGIGCGDHKTPGVYTNVSKFRKWIDEVFKEKGLPTDSYTA